METPSTTRVGTGPANPDEGVQDVDSTTGLCRLLARMAEEFPLDQAVTTAHDAVLGATHALCLAAARLSPPPSSPDGLLCPAADSEDVLATYAVITDAIKALVLVTEALELRLRALGAHPSSDAADGASANARLVLAAECGFIHGRLSEALLLCPSPAQPDYQQITTKGRR